MPAKKKVTLVAPDGRTYPPTSDPVEITDLKARGYKVAGPKKAAAKPAADKN